MFLKVLSMPYGNVITGMGFFKLAALINLLNLLLFASLILVLPNPKIFNLGAFGIALAVLISNIFMGIACRIFAKQKCPEVDIRAGIKFILATPFACSAMASLEKLTGTR